MWCVFAPPMTNKSHKAFSPRFRHYLLSWKVNDGSNSPFLVPSPCRVQRYFWLQPEILCVGFVWFSGSDHVIFKRLWSSTDFLVEKDNDYCVCQTPCNMTRYGKELSMVKIPSKASAKYLAKKFNKTEQYIGWVSFSSISSPDLSFFSLCWWMVAVPHVLGLHRSPSM